MDDTQEIKRKANPRKNANIFSVLTFGYTLPLFIQGFSKDLTEEDVIEHLDEHSSQKLGDRLEKHWNDEIKRRKDPSLIRCVLKMFGWEFGLLGIVVILNELVFKMIQPLALAQLIVYYSGDGSVSDNEAYMYAGIIVGVSFLNVISGHTYMLYMQQLGMKLRVAITSLVYRKALRLSKKALVGTTVGQIVNLLSNDVSRCDHVVLHIHVLWVCPLLIGLVVFALYTLVGLISTVGVLFMIMFVPIQMYLGKKTSVLRLKTALKTDERIRFMNEIISGIQVIKMYTWEIPFAKLVALSRKLEINHIRATSYIRGIVLSFAIFVTRFAIFLTILVYVLRGNMLTAEYVFIVTAFYNVLRQSLTMHFPKGITDLAELSISMKRLKKFLLYDEIDAQILSTSTDLIWSSNKEEKLEHGDAYICLSNVSAQWVTNNNNETLKDICMEAHDKQLVALVGAVGSGKSSLLHVILQELPLTAGTLKVNGKISYSSQEPWIFAGTVRQNILFGEPMVESRYKKVIEVCALTNDLFEFQYGDNTLVGERGVTLSGGQKARVNLARAVYKDADIYLLDDPLSAVDTHVGKQLFEECIISYLKEKCVILVTHQLQFLNEVDNIYLIESGKIASKGTYAELNSKNVEFAQHGKFNEEESSNSTVKSALTEFKQSKNGDKPEVIKELRSYGKIDGEVYFSYFKAGGSLLFGILMLSLLILTQALASGSDYFLTYWVNSEQRRTMANETTTVPEELERETSIYIYSSIIAVMVVVTFSRSFSFFNFCMRASTNLHNTMFSSVIKAPMQFFDVNPSGRVLNRFAKDIGTVDEVLPAVAIDCFQVGLQVIGVTIVISTVNPWMLIASAIILIVYYLMRVVYLRTTRSLKRLEGITRSPVYAHMNASIQGLTTIRAFSAQKILKKEFDNHQNFYTSVFYSYLICARAFGFWLDFINVIYIGFVTFSFFLFQSEQYGGNVGLAITQAISLTGMFQWGMRQWSELETQMTSVERIVEYTKIEPEYNPQEQIPPSTWPEAGNLRFSSVFLRYSTSDSYVLKDVNFAVKANEKIGVVGRTGAGKSSLIYALFQLTPTEGDIIIDDINITKIPLEALRSKISIIPQEPVLFSGTIRKNLDPFNEYADTDIWNALEEVELKNEISDLPLGLNNLVSESGSNFSVGQRQLLCLARAIIRHNKILLMDEATANVDPHTDELIQKTIRRKFVDCTVLTIAHRLHTIMDSDKVLVMNYGVAVEFDHPYLLLKDKTTIFYSMVLKTGTDMADILTRVAEENYKSKSSALH